jgi:hypothetical protein
MPFLSLRALWKGLKGNSLIFSLVFAMALMGFSLAGMLRLTLRELGLWWPLMLLLPFVVIGRLARLEARLRLRPRIRRACVLILIGGSISLTLALWRYESRLEDRREASVESRLGPKFVEPENKPELPRGPRHRR